MTKPNVLIFCVDEMRADHLACMGNSIVRTPNLDKLAARGTLFTRAYCNNPICMPARATMFTGLLPRDHGLRVNGQSLPIDWPTLPGVLADDGYRTHAAGKLHLTPWVPMITPPDIEKYPECMEYWNNGAIGEFPLPYYGFQTVDFVGGHGSYAYGPYIQWLEKHGGDRQFLTPKRALPPPSGAPHTYKMAMPRELHFNRYIADSIIRLIKESARSDAPFMAWCSFPDPHLPIAPPQPYCDMYDPGNVALPIRREGEFLRLPPFYEQILNNNVRQNGIGPTLKVSDSQLREMIALTYGMITHIDEEIGRVMLALEESGMSDNTVVMFVSDHGDMMGDHGLLWKGPYTFKGCIVIPLIVAVPGMPGNRISDSLVCQMDLMPSVLDCCGVPMPGSDWTARETPFKWGQIRDLSLWPGRSWKGLLDGSAGATRDSVVIENDSLSTGYNIRCLVTDRYRLTIYPGTEYGELFDLKDDPDELFNLWHDPARVGLRGELTKQLLDAYCLDTPFHPVPPWNS